jgi:predicted transglutaminase-like cysteine proteinase
MFARKYSLRTVAGFVASIGIAAGLLAAAPSAASAASHKPASMTAMPAPAPAVGAGFVFPAVFGKNSVAPGGPQPFKQWANIFDRFSAELAGGSGYCQASLFTSCHLQDWQEELRRNQGRDVMSQLDAVNRYMNKVRFMPDLRNYRQNDYWASPVEFMKNGGDCEDYAIAKYMSLRALGVADERMRIVVLMDTAKRQGHAVLVVATDAGLMVLDNQLAQVTPAAQVAHYMPVFSMNQGGWWVHR